MDKKKLAQLGCESAWDLYMEMMLFPPGLERRVEILNVFSEGDTPNSQSKSTNTPSIYIKSTYSIINPIYKSQSN